LSSRDRFVTIALAPWAGPRIEVAPFRLSGTVYATLLNHRRSLAALGDAVAAAPYRGAPKSVVLAVKPHASLVAPGGAVVVDDDADEREVGAALGVVIGTTACAVAEADALGHVAGFLVVADCTAPHASHFRPQIRAMARDASCVLGAAVVARDLVADPDALAIRVFVDARLVQSASTAEHVRSAARLIAEVSDFMTLAPGDILLTGSAPDGARARAGATIAIEIDGVGRLETRVVANASRRAA
jgi:5-oxopent-3-ene-1,2,5-tricarboxylate decarboxylase/2-hydroxyhepta-2,4-diene-1,7-dioate isomerase